MSNSWVKVKAVRNRSGFVTEVHSGLSGQKEDMDEESDKHIIRMAKRHNIVVRGDLTKHAGVLYLPKSRTTKNS